MEKELGEKFWTTRNYGMEGSCGQYLERGQPYNSYWVSSKTNTLHPIINWRQYYLKDWENIMAIKSNNEKH